MDNREIWFLTGSQGLYGDETLQQVADQSRQIAAELDKSDELAMPVVWKPVLTDADAILRRNGAVLPPHRARLTQWYGDSHD